MRGIMVLTLLPVLIILFTSARASKVFAHCDTLDGPVIAAAKIALETGDVNPVLIWVQEKDEEEIKRSFQKTLVVRKLSPEAKELADMYFFETLVRIHRAGEGAPYTGLKPAGLDLGPAIPAADKAIETGSIEPLLKLLTNTLQDSVREHFMHASEKKNYKKEDIKAGREYIEAYVLFIHLVEKIYESATTAVHGHYPETGAEEGSTEHSEH